MSLSNNYIKRIADRDGNIEEYEMANIFEKIKKLIDIDGCDQTIDLSNIETVIKKYGKQKKAPDEFVTSFVEQVSNAITSSGVIASDFKNKWELFSYFFDFLIESDIEKDEYYYNWVASEEKKSEDRGGNGLQYIHDSAKMGFNS